MLPSSCGRGENLLKLLQEVINIQEAEAAHEHIDATTTGFDSGLLDGEEIIVLHWPASRKAASVKVSALLALKITWGSFGFWVTQSSTHPARCGGG